MDERYWVIAFLGLITVTVFARGAARKDDTASFIGHALAGLTCLIAFGVGLAYGPPWVWVAATALFLVNLGWLFVRMRSA